MRDGDIFILNDPYTGGTHLPDIAVIMPVFHRGTVIALSGAMTHHQDVGGMSAGSVPTNATEIYQEGLRIPPLKLREAGVLQRHADRDAAPERAHPRYGDGRPQCPDRGLHGRRRAGSRSSPSGYGHNQLASIFDELLQRSETMTRKALRAIPEGTYRFVDYLDNDGIELDRPIRIEVAVTVERRRRSSSTSRHEPAGAGPAQLRAVRLAGGGVLRGARADRPDHPDQRRLLPADHAAPAARARSSIREEPAPVNARTSTIKRITGCIDRRARARSCRSACRRRRPASCWCIAFGGQQRGWRPLRRRRADRRRQRRQRRRWTASMSSKPTPRTA